MALWIPSHFEQRSEYICYLNQNQVNLLRASKVVPTGHNILERLNWAIRFIHFVEARYLNEPTNVMREKFVVHNPFCEFVPFVWSSPVYAQTPFHILLQEIVRIACKYRESQNLIFALLQIGHQFWENQNIVVSRYKKVTNLSWVPPDNVLGYNYLSSRISLSNEIPR